MAFACVDGDPFSFALFAVFEVAAGWHRALEQAGFAEHVGDSAGAIVASIVGPGMATAPFVWLALQAIASGDGALYGGRRAFRGVSDAIFQEGSAAIFKPIRNRLTGFHLV